MWEIPREKTREGLGALERGRKKVLALVLTLALALSVAAGAAFTDQKQIKNTEAVDACVALNIIGGYPDGSYKPEGNITRAEFCKMLCIALNGGKEPTLGTSTTPIFNDVRTSANSSWAEKYIEACYVQGIVSGIGGGKFNPNGSVTGTEAAKMLLVALGYNSTNEGFTGASWAVNVNVKATAKGLYEDLETMDASKALTRDNAAQMVWNALNAYEVEYKTNLVSENGQLSTQVVCQDKVVGDNYDKITLLVDKYEAVTEKGILHSVKYDSNDKTYTSKVLIDEKNGTSDVAFDASKDYSELMGQQVKVMYTTDNKTKDVTLLGIYATSKNKTVTALGDDIDYSATNKVEINDKDYELATDVKIVAPNGVDAKSVAGKMIENNAINVTPYFSYTLVDNDNDKVYEYVVVTPFTVDKVDTLTAKKVYFKSTTVADKVDNEDLEDVSYYKDMAEDDYVVRVDDAYTVSGDVEVTKAELVSGTVTGTKAAGDIQLNGTWYQNANTATIDTPKAKDELKYAVVVNGFYFATDGATGSTDKLALVVDLGTKSFGTDYYDVKLLLSDGTTVTSKAYVKDGSKKLSPTVKDLYTYTTSSDGYVLKEIKDGDDIGLDKGKALSGYYKSETNKLNNVRVASNAKVFVIYETNKGKLVDGATADKWKDAANYRVLEAYTDTTVAVMVVDMGQDKNPTAADDALYGVILDAPYTGANADDEDTYVIPRLLTADGIVNDVVVDADEWDTSLTKNMLISYKLSGKEYVEVQKVAGTDYAYIVGAVTEINGKYITVQYKDGSSVKTVDVKTDKDSSVLYFDSVANTDGKGAFKKAMKKDAANYYANVIVVFDTTDKQTDQSYIIKGAAVDIANQLTDKSEKDILVPVSATTYTAEGKTEKGETVSVAPNKGLVLGNEYTFTFTFMNENGATFSSDGTRELAVTGIDGVSTVTIKYTAGETSATETATGAVTGNVTVTSITAK